MEEFDDFGNRSGCSRLLWALILGVALVVFLSSIVSCRTVKVSEKVHQRDSIVLHHHHDTTHFTFVDTMRVEHHVQVVDSSHLHIQFGPGGGTYNAKTGEATNVAGVTETNVHHELRDSIADLSRRLEIARAVNDSLQQSVSDYKSELAKLREVPKQTGYNRFCSWWFWITAILLLAKVACWVMEKFPTTAPYIIVARKFIPFL